MAQGFSPSACVACMQIHGLPVTSPFPRGCARQKKQDSLTLLPILPQIRADSRAQGWSCSPEKVNHNLPYRGVASSNDLSHIDGIGDGLQQHDDLGT